MCKPIIRVKSVCGRIQININIKIYFLSDFVRIRALILNEYLQFPQKYRSGVAGHSYLQVGHTKVLFSGETLRVLRSGANFFLLNRGDILPRLEFHLIFLGEPNG